MQATYYSLARCLDPARHDKGQAKDRVQRTAYSVQEIGLKYQTPKSKDQNHRAKSKKELSRPKPKQRIVRKPDSSLRSE
jgi:hypothetical protein